jgi:hypothetical protein
MARRTPVLAPRWLLPLLALFLALGHVCESPAHVDLVVSPHLTEGAGHAADDRDGLAVAG